MSSRAEAWVGTHLQNLPNTLDELSAFPQIYRRRIFAKLPADVKSRLWRQQLSEYLQHQPSTAAKREVLAKAIRELSPATFEKTPQARARLAGFCQEMARTFSEDEKSILSMLGSREPTFITWQSKQVLLLHKIRASLSVEAYTWPDCQCSVGSWCSCWSCHDYGCGRFDGCGCLWAYECNGFCDDKD